MKIPNYDSSDSEINYKQKYDFMPNQMFSNVNMWTIR